MEPVRLTSSAGSSVPDLTAEVPGWYFQAKCANADSDVFFSTADVDTAAAVAICHAYPVVDACRDFALDQGLTVGIWGGTTPDDRRQQRAA